MPTGAVDEPTVHEERMFTACVTNAREATVLGIVTRLSEDPVAEDLALATDISGCTQARSTAPRG